MNRDYRDRPGAQREAAKVEEGRFRGGAGAKRGATSSPIHRRRAVRWTHLTGDRRTRPNIVRATRQHNTNYALRVPASPRHHDQPHEYRAGNQRVRAREDNTTSQLHLSATVPSGTDEVIDFMTSLLTDLIVSSFRPRSVSLACPVSTLFTPRVYGRGTWHPTSQVPVAIDPSLRQPSRCSLRCGGRGAQSTASLGLGVRKGKESPQPATRSKIPMVRLPTLGSSCRPPPRCGVLLAVLFFAYSSLSHSSVTGIASIRGSTYML